MLYFQVRNDQNTSENVRNLKKFQLKSDNDVFEKIRQNAQILKSRVSVSVSNFKSRVSVSQFLMKSQSRSRLEILPGLGLGLEGYGLDYSTGML